MFLLKTVLLTVTSAGVKDWVVGHCISLNWKCGVCDTWVISFNATYQAEEYWLRQVSSANYMLKECCNPNRQKQACVVSQICCCCSVLVQIDPFWYCAALASSPVTTQLSSCPLQMSLTTKRKISASDCVYWNPYQEVV